MHRPRQQTQTSDFSEFGMANLPRQTRLPQDDESSFSSLDSDLANIHYNTVKAISPSITPRQSARKYHYLDADSSFRGTIRTPRALEQPQHQSKPLSKSPHRSEVRHADKAKPHNLGNPPSFLQNEQIKASLDNIRAAHQIEDLLSQNETYRQEMELLRASNQSIQRELRANHEEIRKLKHQVAQSAHRVHDSYIRQEVVDRELGQRLEAAEEELRVLRSQLAHSQKKYFNQKSKNAGLQSDIGHLRDKLASFERQLYEINIKQEQLKHSYAEVEQGHIRKIAQLEKQLQQSKKQQPSETKWQDSFIDVLVDMIQKIALRDGVKLQPDLPRKKKAKECWKYLKKSVLAHRRREEATQPLRD